MSWIITGTEKNKGLLDEFSGAAAAYSLRDLSVRRNAPVVRVRRSSDNTEQDFTATQITDGTLTAFCGAGDGLVRTWYDQSGNSNDAIQATTSSQPVIVSSGALILSGTKPALQFNGRFLDAPDSSTLRLANLSMFAVCLSINISAVQVVASKNYGGSYTASYGIALVSSKHRPVIDNGSERTVFSPSALSSNVRYLLNISFDGAQLRGAHNGSAEYSTATTGSIRYNTLGLRLGLLGNNSFPLTGSASEIIIFSSANLANRTGIEANINAHYSIF